MLLLQTESPSQESSCRGRCSDPAGSAFQSGPEDLNRELKAVNNVGAYCTVCIYVVQVDEGQVYTACSGVIGGPVSIKGQLQGVQYGYLHGLGVLIIS